MNKIRFLTALLLLVVISHTNANAVPMLTNSYFATNVWGNQAPPTYALRLDGFYDGNSSTEVTFGFNDVLFNQYDDGTARLFGTVSVVEYNGSTASSFVGMSYTLNVNFTEVTSASDIAKIDGYDASWMYYNIDPAGVEMVSTSDTTDYSHLWTYPDVNANVLKPFQVGTGANKKNNKFGAAGWLSYEHNYPGGPYGQQGSYSQASDFLMNLEPVPEPGTLALFGIGMAGAAIRRKFKKK